MVLPRLSLNSGQQDGHGDAVATCEETDDQCTTSIKPNMEMCWVLHVIGPSPVKDILTASCFTQLYLWSREGPACLPPPSVSPLSTCCLPLLSCCKYPPHVCHHLHTCLLYLYFGLRTLQNLLFSLTPSLRAFSHTQTPLSLILSLYLLCLSHTIILWWRSGSMGFSRSQFLQVTCKKQKKSWERRPSC